VFHDLKVSEIRFIRESMTMAPGSQAQKHAYLHTNTNTPAQTHTHACMPNTCAHTRRMHAHLHGFKCMGFNMALICRIIIHVNIVDWVSIENDDSDTSTCNESAILQRRLSQKNDDEICLGGMVLCCAQIRTTLPQLQMSSDCWSGQSETSYSFCMKKNQRKEENISRWSD